MDDYNSALFNWRVQINPFGGLKKGKKDKGWKEGNEIFGKAMKLSIGYGGAFTNDNETESDVLLPNGQNLLGSTFDMTFSAHYFYLNGAYTMFSGEASIDKTSTYQATIGYNIKIAKVWFMPVVRYDYWQADTSTNGSIEDGESVNDLWIGLNFFGDKHNMKAQAFYRIHTNKDAKGLDKEDNTFYLQFTTNFGKNI